MWIASRGGRRQWCVLKLLWLKYCSSCSTMSVSSMTDISISYHQRPVRAGSSPLSLLPLPLSHTTPFLPALNRHHDLFGEYPTQRWVTPVLNSSASCYSKGKPRIQTSQKCLALSAKYLPCVAVQCILAILFSIVTRSLLHEIDMA